MHNACKQASRPCGYSDSTTDFSEGAACATRKRTHTSTRLGKPIRVSKPKLRVGTRKRPGQLKSCRSYRCGSKAATSVGAPLRRNRASSRPTSRSWSTDKSVAQRPVSKTSALSFHGLLPPSRHHRPPAGCLKASKATKRPASLVPPPEWLDIRLHIPPMLRSALPCGRTQRHQRLSGWLASRGPEPSLANLHGVCNVKERSEERPLG